MVLVLIISATVYLPVSHPVAAQDSDLQKVNVKIVIENPDYFWQYPFRGQKLTAIRLSGLGKSTLIPAGSDGKIVEFETPRGYSLRLSIDFPASQINKQFYYVKRNVKADNSSLIITLRAPDYQPVIINSADFDQAYSTPADNN